MPTPLNPLLEATASNQQPNRNTQELLLWMTGAPVVKRKDSSPIHWVPVRLSGEAAMMRREGQGQPRSPSGSHHPRKSNLVLMTTACVDVTGLFRPGSYMCCWGAGSCTAGGPGARRPLEVWAAVKYVAKRKRSPFRQKTSGGKGDPAKQGASGPLKWWGTGSLGDRLWGRRKAHVARRATVGARFGRGRHLSRQNGIMRC